MKKLFFLSLILVLGLGAFLAGCAGSDEEGVPGDRARTDLERKLDENKDKITKCNGPLCDESAGSENTDALCEDGIDNDGDGPIDCADADCFSGVSVTVCATTICTGAACDTACRGDECDNDDSIVRPETPPVPIVAILEPAIDRGVVELPSALYGQLYEAYEIKAGEGSGDYSWTFVNLTEEELAGIGLTGGNVYGRPPVGMELVPQTPNAETKEQMAIIRGRPRDEFGSYVFKVKVTDNVDTTRSDDRVFTIRLADKIVIDVYERQGDRWTLKPLSRRSGGNFSNTGYASIAAIMANINVSAGKTLKLVARGNGDVSNYRWCLWGGSIPVCGTRDVDNGYFKLTAETKVPWEVTKTSSSGSSVRYLSAGRSFNAPTARGGTFPISVDDLEGNASLLYFRNIDFECHGQLSGYHSSPVITIKGNISTSGSDKTVSTSLNAFNGSEGESYSWQMSFFSSYVVQEEYEQLLTTSLSETTGSPTTDVSFELRAPNDKMTLKQYRDMLDEEYLSSTTVDVEDTICGGSDSYTIRYKLSDKERDEHGAKIEDDNNHYLFHTIGEMKVKVTFDHDENFIQDTTSGSKMEVRFFDEDGNGLAHVSHNLHPCNVGDYGPCEANTPVKLYAGVGGGTKIDEIKSMDIKFESPDEYRESCGLFDWDCDEDTFLTVYMDNIRITAGKEDGDSPYWQMGIDQESLKAKGIWGRVISSGEYGDGNAWTGNDGGNDKVRIYDLTPLFSTMEDVWELRSE